MTSIYRIFLSAILAAITALTITYFNTATLSFDLTLFAIVMLACLLTSAISPALAGLPAPSFGSSTREEGTVKWFNASKGYGFLTRANGEEIFVHFRSIRGNGRRALHEGQQVSFSVRDGEKGPQAEEVDVLGNK